MTCGPAPLIRACVTWLLVAAGACRPSAAPPGGGGCADVETLRVCWDGTGPRVVKGETPAPRARGPAFACAGDRCEQRHPRMPDAGEWQCMDSAGATICLGGNPAAGVAPAAPEPGWFCGPRRGGDPGERICVDLSPDFPDGHARGWRCRTLYDGPPRRACDRDAEAHTLGETCDARHPCVDGSRCTDGRCVPERPAPACWRDEDCAGGRCRFGSCLPREGQR